MSENFEFQLTAVLVVAVIVAAQLIQVADAAPHIDGGGQHHRQQHGSARRSTAQQADRHRVKSPCAGSNALTTGTDSEEAMSVAATDDTQLRQSVERVYEMLLRLNRRADDFAAQYKTERNAVRINNMYVDGMPLYHHVVDSTVNPPVLADMVTDTIDKLSRVAVLLDLVAVEEQLHEPEPMMRSIEQLEDDPDHGLYTVLCQLHRVHAAATTAAASTVATTTSGDVNHAERREAVVEAASRVTLSAVTRAANRHLRAYSIFDDMTQLLMHLMVRFNNARRIV